MDALPDAIRRADRLVLVSHALCPYVQRAVIALTEKGVAFERIDIDLADKPGWFLRLSPLGQTPVLLVPHGGEMVPLFESAVICDYLDETLAPALHPADPLQRARHRAWVEVASSLLNQIWLLYTAPDADRLEQQRRALAERIGRIDAGLGAGPWFGGDAFSLVDAAFAPAFRYVDVFDGFWDGRLFEHAPRALAWRRALAARDSVRHAVDPGYPARLRAFVERQGGRLGALSAESA